MATGLYSPVNLAQHASSAENIANIIKQGFIPSGASSPGFQIADIFQPGKKVFTSTSPSLLSQYGDDVVDVISSAKNLRLPSGGIDFTKGTIGFGDEIVSKVDQANKGMELARRLRAGEFANSALARRLLETGTNVNPDLLRTGIFGNPFLQNLLNMGGRALQFASRGAGPLSLFVPSRELGSGELTPEFIQEQQALGQLPVQQAIRQKQEETQQKIIDEVKQSGGGGGPAGMVGTPTGPGQTRGPAGMGSAPRRRSKPDLRRRATGGLVELEGDTRQLFPVGGDSDLATTQNAPVFLNRRLDEQLGIGGLLSANPGIIARPGPILNRPMPMPMPFPGPRLPEMPDYSSQFEQIGEQLGGFGKQLDALGSFNEQVGGIGKQFEAVNNKLDSLEKGLGSLGNQIASFENMQKAQPQEVMQPRRPSINPFGLANLFMNMRRF